MIPEVTKMGRTLIRTSPAKMEPPLASTFRVAQDHGNQVEMDGAKCS